VLCIRCTDLSIALHLASKQESYIELAAKLLRRKRMAQERWRRTVTRLPTDSNNSIAHNTTAGDSSADHTANAATSIEQPLRPTVSPFCELAVDCNSPRADVASQEEHVSTDAVQQCTTIDITATSDGCDDTVEQQQQCSAELLLQSATADAVTVSSAASSSSSSKAKAARSSVRRVQDAKTAKLRPRKQLQQRKAARTLHATAATAAAGASSNSMVLLPPTSPITAESTAAFALDTVAEDICSSSSSGNVQVDAVVDVAADVDRRVTSSYGGLLDGALPITVLHSDSPHVQLVEFEVSDDDELEVQETGTIATAAAAAFINDVSDEIDSSSSDSESLEDNSSCSSAAVSEQCASETADATVDDVVTDVADDEYSVMSALTTQTRQPAASTAESDSPDGATAVQRSLGTALPFAPLFGGYWDDYEEHERQTVAEIVISNLDNGCPTDNHSTAATTAGSSTAGTITSSCSLAGFSSNRGGVGAVGDDSSLADGGIGHHELKLHLKELGARQDFFKLYRIIARQREVRFKIFDVFLACCTEVHLVQTYKYVLLMLVLCDVNVV
jgi:hypothetical protein